MTCGLYPQEGHTFHLCTSCMALFQDCPACRMGRGCNFKPITSEILKVRDELFSNKKVLA